MPFDPSLVKGLCLDLDGTLSDSDDSMVERLARRIEPFRWLMFGREPKQISRRIMMTIESPGNFIMSLPDRIGMDEALARVVDTLNRRRKQARIPYLLVPGIAAALVTLQAHYPLALVSARDEHTAMEFLRQFELLPFFSLVATAQTCRHTKPFPDPILWVGEQWGIAPSQLVMVGDTTVDIRAGKAAGAQAIAVLCGFGEEPELRRAGADLIIPSTSLLPDVLLSQPDQAGVYTKGLPNG